ncbi:Aldo/keto reductase [Neocallimastix lanati (nom. inval.)]|jgi:aryl-alcohol dehydrogenase-like predicted oxidoreductase|uniref:Aldo/keto reductase n=1 Tax=Neocallimastix californiae TaxID=1754190 RepID=A0A1Y2DAB0_9FUNG|nr:Aldo/keto reductase [Neocallimastix sp. JGI-2020a]ORY56046.1 Aldo/keto reductase [Neocallimastix californiae]|eukprot:ORY56046.1 Aldo/keto reductase [Neocallimastix californiae]
MEYTTLGKSGIKISKICLGCMTFGERESFTWLLNQEQTDEMVKRALDLGINFFDTANCYNNGTSEIYLGNAIKKYAKREDVVIATKVRLNEGGLSREAILREIEGSLKRLQMDYVDLYIIHRWDYNTPIEETMGALNELVQSGKVRALGCSAMFSYQLYKAQECARQHGWATFVSIQNHYNLVYREEEREMIQLLEEEGVVMTPYSPLAGGRLARLWDADTERFKKDEFAKRKYDADREIDLPVINRVKEIADKHQVTMGQVSMSWLLSRPLMAAPIVGVTKIKHLEDACKAVNLKLTEEENKYLEELYVPHRVVGAVKKEIDVKF